MLPSILSKLVSRGQQLSRQAPYSVSSGTGFISSLDPSYIAWVSECEELLLSSLGKDSNIFKIFQKGHQISIVNNPVSNFRNAHSYFLGAIMAALRISEHHEIYGKKVPAPKIKNNKVFVVHGHDEELKEELEQLLKEIGADPIILHKQHDKGKTLIEKLEAYSDVAYAIVLLTPDDWLLDSKQEVARQNVIFEFGYFVGCLGRENICCIRKQNVSIPPDLDGFVYKQIKVSANEIKTELIRELSAAGLTLKT